MTEDPNELYPLHKAAVEDPVYSTGKNHPKPRWRAARSRFVTPTPFDIVNEVKLGARRFENWFGAAAVLQNDSQKEFMVFAWSPIDLPHPEIGTNVRMFYHTSSDSKPLNLHPNPVNGDPQSTLTINKGSTHFLLRDAAREVWKCLVLSGWKPFLYDAHT